MSKSVLLPCLCTAVLPSTAPERVWLGFSTIWVLESLQTPIEMYEHFLFQRCQSWRAASRYLSADTLFLNSALAAPASLPKRWGSFRGVCGGAGASVALDNVSQEILRALATGTPVQQTESWEMHPFPASLIYSYTYKQTDSSPEDIARRELSQFKKFNVFIVVYFLKVIQTHFTATLSSLWWSTHNSEWYFQCYSTQSTE